MSATPSEPIRMPARLTLKRLNIKYQLFTIDSSGTVQLPHSDDYIRIDGPGHNHDEGASEKGIRFFTCSVELRYRHRWADLDCDYDTAENQLSKFKRVRGTLKSFVNLERKTEHGEVLIAHAEDPRRDVDDSGAKMLSVKLVLPGGTEMLYGKVIEDEEVECVLTPTEKKRLGLK